MAKNGFLVLDSDMHIMEPTDIWERYIHPTYKDRAPRIMSREPRDMTVDIEGVKIPIPEAHRNPKNLASLKKGDEVQAVNYSDPIARGWDNLSQLDAMDKEGIDVAVLYPTRGLMPLGMNNMDTGYAAAIAAAYNDWLYDFCQADQKRMYGAAMVSVHDISFAVAEVQRAVDKLGFKGVFLRPNLVGGVMWHDPHYDPLWAKCEELGIPVGFHEGGRVRLPQFGSEFEENALYHTISHPTQMMMALVSLIGGGVASRFPGLKVAFLEANCSWVPWLIWRLEEHIGPEHYSARIQLPHITMSAVDYFKRQFYVSLEADEEPARYMVDSPLGNDNVVFSTDYPHLDSKYPEALNLFMTLPLDNETRRKFLWDNCSRFYDLVEAPVPAK